MAMRPGFKDFLWMSAGAGLLLALMLTVLMFRDEQKPEQRLAFKANRIDAVSQMRVALASASEAEKAAVLATTDEDSQRFADQARAASARVDEGRQHLEALLQTGGTQQEKDLLAQFAEAFADFRRVDEELLSLAVKNTNLKAYALAFGPAADTVRDTDAALARLASESAALPDAGKATSLAFEARLGMLRLLSMLPPHIAEGSDNKMEEMETAMAGEDQRVRTAMHDLAALPGVAESTDLATAVAGWDRFAAIKTQILALSRENTNVRSLTISLNRKRNVMTVCDADLSALEQAIQEEPIPGVDYGRFGRPR